MIYDEHIVSRHSLYMIITYRDYLEELGLPSLNHSTQTIIPTIRKYLKHYFYAWRVEFYCYAYD